MTIDRLISVRILLQEFLHKVLVFPSILSILVFNVGHHLISISGNFTLLAFSRWGKHWWQSSLLPVSLRIDVLLLNEPLSSLHGLSLDIVSSLWEQIAQVSKFLFVHAHENNVGKGLCCCIDLFLRLGRIRVLLQSFDDNIRFKFL